MITKVDVSKEIEKWGAFGYLKEYTFPPAYYEYLKANEPKNISKIGIEGDAEYMIYCGQKIYKSRLILNPYRNFKDIKDLIK